MFTGIVEEVGTLVARREQTDAAQLAIRARTVLGDVALGDSISVNGVCLTVTGVEPDADGTGVWSTDVMAETLHRSSLGGLAAGDPVNLERAVTLQTRLGGHLVQGHVDGVGAVLTRTPGEHWEVVRIGLPPALAPYLVEKGSVAVDGVSLTVSAVSAVRDPEPWFEVEPHPHHPARDDAGHPRRGQPGEPGGRRGRQVRASGCWRPGDDRRAGPPGRRRGRDRRDQGRPRRRRRGRRGPRERGRPHLRRRAGDAGAGRVHGPLDLRLRLRGPHRGRRRPARPAADVPRQPGPPRHRLRRHRRRPRGRGHRHLRRRPGAHHPAAGRPRDRRRPSCPAPGTSSRCGPRTAACCAGPGTPRPPSTSRSWPGCGPPACCASWSARRSPPAWRTPRSCAPSPTSTSWSWSRSPTSSPTASASTSWWSGSPRRSCRCRRAPSPRSATAAPTTSASTSPSSTGDIGDGEDVLVRVHSECLTGDVFGSLRCDCGPQLQAALGGGGRGGPRRRPLHPRARGPGDRPAAQAAGLPAAGPRRRHRGRQPRPRPARRRPRLRHRRADPRRPRRPHHAAAHEQPGEAGRPRGLRPAGPRPGAAAQPRDRREPRLPAHQAGPDGPPAGHPRARDRSGPDDVPTVPGTDVPLGRTEQRL